MSGLMLTVAGGRGMDTGVADMRRRIGASAPLLPRHLPWAAGAVAIGALSLALWLDTFEVASLLASSVSRLF